MISSRWLLNLAVGSQTYIWVDVLLIRETKKALLVMFDGKKIWIPKVWIARIKQNRKPICHCESAAADETTSIKISKYHWAKKF